jgi:hypothetical protein
MDGCAGSVLTVVGAASANMAKGVTDALRATAVASASTTKKNIDAPRAAAAACAYTGCSSPVAVFVDLAARTVDSGELVAIASRTSASFAAIGSSTALARS